MKRKALLLNASLFLVFSFSLLNKPLATIQASEDNYIDVTHSGTLVGMVEGSGFNLIGRSGLIALAEFVNAGSGLETSGVSFRLSRDSGISESTVDGSGLRPIGHGIEGTEDLFYGDFDGSGVTILNLSIIPFNDGSGDEQGVGLFGWTEGSVISNVTISGVNIVTDAGKIGSLIGQATDSQLENITITGRMYIEGSNNVGGLVGYAIGTSFNDVVILPSTIQINGNGNLGGLIGSLERSQAPAVVNNTFIETASLIMSGVGEYIGGLIGFNAGEISNSFVKTQSLIIQGDISAGGFAGGNVDGLINRSLVNADSLIINGESKLGGFIGDNDNATVYNSYLYSNSSTISASSTGNSRVGGFVGRNIEGVIQQSFILLPTMTLSGVSQVGGYVGFNTSAEPTDGIKQAFLATQTLTLRSTGDEGLFVGSGAQLVENGFANSGTTNGVWINAQNNTESSLDTVTATSLLSIINASGAYELINLTSFPVLATSGVITRSVQPSVSLFWLQEEEEPTPSSSSTPNTGFPTIGETVTYEPLFLTIEADSATIEVGQTFTLTYNAFSTFGPILRDYTDQVVITGSVDTNRVGSYPITLSLTVDDLSITKEILITVVDTQAPVISGPNEVEFFVDGVYEAGITAVDNTDPNITLTLLTEVYTSTASVVEAVWEAKDQYGNRSTFTQLVTIVKPEVRVEEVEVNNQQFVFVIEEDEFDFEKVIVEYVVSTNEPDDSSNWQPFTGSVDVQASERVFVRLSDGTNTTEIRQTVAIPEVVFTRPQVVYIPREEETLLEDWRIQAGIAAGLVLVSIGIGVVIGKRR